MLFALVITLYTSRVILNTLGIQDYGIYNVVAGFVSLFAFLNATLSSSMQRFYNFQIGSVGDNGIAKVYTTGLWIHVLLAVIIILILETFGVWYVNNIMVMPEDRLFAANILYQIVVVSAVLLILQIPYIGAIMAYERMDFYAIISIIDVVFKLAIVLVLPYINLDKLIVYAFLLLMVNVFNICVYFLYAKRKLPSIVLTKETDKVLFKDILSFSGWNLIGTFALMLKGQGLNMLLNVFFGPIINAARGIAFQIYGAISSFGQNIVIAYRPQLVSSYATGYKDRVEQLFFSESKICFSLIAILAVPLMLEMDYVLKIWLGENVPEQTNIFSILVLVDLLICILNTPCTQVVHATGKLKMYQIASSIVNIALLPFCWLLLKLGFDATSSFVTTIVFSCINQTVCVIQTHKVFSFDIKTYIRSVLFPCIVLIILLPILPFLIHVFMSPSVYRLLAVCVACICVAMPLCYYIVLSSVEKIYAIRIIKNILNQLKLH